LLLIGRSDYDSRGGKIQNFPPPAYSEGAAYRSYFSTDELMFSVPARGVLLKNKDEVLAIRLIDFPDQQFATSADHLNEHRVYAIRVGLMDLVVLTDTSVANRVYKTGDW